MKQIETLLKDMKSCPMPTGTADMKNIDAYSNRQLVMRCQDFDTLVRAAAECVDFVRNERHPAQGMPPCVRDFDRLTLELSQKYASAGGAS